MTNEFLNCVKVGIGASSVRITLHRRRGWELVKKWEFTKGENAIRVEAEALKHIRKTLGLTHYLSKEEMPQGGHTETFSLDQVSALNIRSYIEKIIKG
jgi:hypothetical protein